MEALARLADWSSHSARSHLLRVALEHSDSNWAEAFRAAAAAGRHLARGRAAQTKAKRLMRATLDEIPCFRVEHATSEGPK